jgi:hypothetical protein
LAEVDFPTSLVGDVQLRRSRGDQLAQLRCDRRASLRLDRV